MCIQNERQLTQNYLCYCISPYQFCLNSPEQDSEDQISEGGEGGLINLPAYALTSAEFACGVRFLTMYQELYSKGPQTLGCQKHDVSLD